MGRISVSLDESNSEWVHEQAGDDVEAYVNEVMRRDRERKAAEAKLGDMIDEAEASGFCEDSIEDIWAEAEARYRASHG